MRWTACATTITDDSGAEKDEKNESENETNEDEEEEEEIEWYGNDRSEKEEDDQFIVTLEQARVQWQRHTGAHKSYSIY